MGDTRLILGDCKDVMATLAEGSVDLIATDPPYFRVKDDEEWDRQWPTADAFLVWISELCGEWRRVLAPNGSLYVFASPEMATRVEHKISEAFHVLNRITWRKADAAGNGQWKKQSPDDWLRSYFPQHEAIIFAEQYGSDQTADDASGYTTACEATKRSVIGEYLKAEFQRGGITQRQIAALFPSITGGTTGCVSNWLLGYNCPTAEQYQRIRDFLDAHITPPGGPYLRREYEDLRREYEDLRRPFNISSDVPYTDVWDFPTVPPRPGKHPCEKPLAMIEHIVAASSRPGDLVLDCFAGSGVTGQACRNLGRRCILIEKDAHWVNAARVWLDRPHAYLPRERTLKPMPLFDHAGGVAS